MRLDNGIRLLALPFLLGVFGASAAPADQVLTYYKNVTQQMISNLRDRMPTVLLPEERRIESSIRYRVVEIDHANRIYANVESGVPIIEISVGYIRQHYCPVRSRIESAGWGDRVSFHGSLMAARPVKWAFSQIG